MSAIHRDDLEAKLHEIEGAFKETAESAKRSGAVLAAGALVLIALVYLWGRRKGRKSSAKVEIYRVSG